MAYREIISAELRFKIFKRDNFTCQYCGRKAPDVVLELDHIRPVSKGGDKRESNLITSCFECNRGKSDTLVPQMEDKSAQKDFEDNFQKYKQRYGYYTNYIAKVIRNETGRKPIKLYIDQFVNRSFKNDNDFYEFKKEFEDVGNVLRIVKECERYVISYKAHKKAFTNSRRNTLDELKNNKDVREECRHYRDIVWSVARDMGLGKSGFKSNLTMNVFEYFCAKRYEYCGDIDYVLVGLENEIEEFVDWCINILKKSGKENVYKEIFDKIDNYLEERRDKNCSIGCVVHNIKCRPIGTPKRSGATTA